MKIGTTLIITDIDSPHLDEDEFRTPRRILHDDYEGSDEIISQMSTSKSYSLFNHYYKGS